MISSSLSASELVRIAFQKLAYYREDSKDFEAFRPSVFTPTYGDDFHAAILKYSDIPTDENFRDLGTLITDRIEQLMQDARSSYSRLRYFAKEVFPDKKGIQNHLGVNDYDTVRKNTVRMFMFLRNVLVNSSPYRDALFAAGMSEDVFTQLTAIVNDLDKAILERDKFKGDRETLTLQRTKASDELYQMIVMVCTAGKEIYRDAAPSQRRRYVIYMSKSTTDTIPTREIAANNATKFGDVETMADEQLEISNTGNVMLQFYIGNATLSEVPAYAVNVLPNQTVRRLSNDISSVELMGVGYLIGNNNADSEGRFTVVVEELFEEEE